MFNDDAEYAASRIVGTYLPLTEKRGLAYILDVKKKQGSNSLEQASVVAAVKKDPPEVMKIKDFLFAVGTLGYVNSGYLGATYLIRLPLRRDFKQGLRANQLAIQRNTSLNNISSEWLSSHVVPVSNCLNGVYPSLEESIESIDEINEDTAFSKMFALSSKYKLLYKGFNVGELTKEDKLKLEPKFSFLEQELSKVVGNEKISL
jgi:hypothetical protein